MNKPIFEVNNNSLNLSLFLSKNFENENDLKVDEIQEPQATTSNGKGVKGVFDLTETSFIRKNSNNLQLKELLSISQDDKFFSNEDEEKK